MAPSEDDPLYCDRCDRKFFNEYNFKRHLTTARHLNPVATSPEGKLRCEHCPASFCRVDNLRRHIRTEHPEGEQVAMVFRCGLCPRRFTSKDDLLTHREEQHVFHHDFRLQESAHQRQCQLLRCYFPDNIRTMDEAFFHSYEHMKKLLSTLSVEMSYFKVSNYCWDARGGNVKEEIRLTSFLSFSFFLFC
jgi:hypothetical protein